jgi:hypothetical protein
MKIIDRLPFADRPHIVTVRGEAVDVDRDQIIVWVSIDDMLRPLPAILARSPSPCPGDAARPARDHSIRQRKGKYI